MKILDYSKKYQFNDLIKKQSDKAMLEEFEYYISNLLLDNITKENANYLDDLINKFVKKWIWTNVVDIENYVKQDLYNTDFYFDAMNEFDPKDTDEKEMFDYETLILYNKFQIYLNLENIKKNIVSDLIIEWTDLFDKELSLKKLEKSLYKTKRADSLSELTLVIDQHFNKKDI